MSWSRNPAWGLAGEHDQQRSDVSASSWRRLLDSMVRRAGRPGAVDHQPISRELSRTPVQMPSACIASKSPMGR
ncbi:hypothetical protein ACFVYG_20435 [Streptomyces sp. NPDC058256]|uniref:hypothetical protein n=1 Tax=Streptomyces sp. NPDC058256 TaxID=3346408 RepID=UPI0036EB5E8D